MIPKICGYCSRASRGWVKEQTAGLCAQQLAANGFVALTFDASHQAASEALPRFPDNPMNRVGDIYSAVDYPGNPQFLLFYKPVFG